MLPTVANLKKAWRQRKIKTVKYFTKSEKRLLWHHAVRKKNCTNKQQGDGPCNSEQDTLLVRSDFNKHWRETLNFFILRSQVSLWFAERPCISCRRFLAIIWPRLPDLYTPTQASCSLLNNAMSAERATYRQSDCGSPRYELTKGRQCFWQRRYTSWRFHLATTQPLAASAHSDADASVRQSQVFGFAVKCFVLTPS